VERLAYLNFRYLFAAFYRLGHPLRERLGVLRALSLSYCIKEYSDVLSLDIVPSESFTRHELSALLGTPLACGEEACQCSGGDVLISSAPRAIDCDVRVWCVVDFLYDGSLIEGFADFAVHQMGVDLDIRS
jgi:hypothetical protein